MKKILIIVSTIVALGLFSCEKEKDCKTIYDQNMKNLNDRHNQGVMNDNVYQDLVKQTEKAYQDCQNN